MGYDQSSITYLEVCTDASKQSIGNASQSVTLKTVKIDGILIGVQARTGIEVNAINFKYKVYTTTPAPSALNYFSVKPLNTLLASN